MLWSPISPPPPTAPSHLPTSTISPLSHTLQLPNLPLNYHFYSHNPSPHLIYHCQSDSITHPPLNYNAPATPPSLLINYHYHMFDGDQQ